MDIMTDEILSLPFWEVSLSSIWKNKFVCVCVSHAVGSHHSGKKSTYAC